MYNLKPYAKACLLGDSITKQNDNVVTGNTYIESYGYFNALNVLMGQCFDYTPVNNYGVSGNATADVVARLSDITTAKNTYGCSDCFVMIGTNDSGSTGISLETITGNYDTIIAHIKALGMRIHWIPILPRSKWDGLDAEEIALREQVILDANAHAAAYENDVDFFYYGDVYTDFGNGENAPVAGYTYDDLHPSPLGAARIAEAMWPRIRQRYITGSAPRFQTNLITNSALTGDDGTVAVRASGIAPTGWTLDSNVSGTYSIVGSRDADGSYVITGSVVGGSSFHSCQLKITGVDVSSANFMQAYIVADFTESVNVKGNPIKLIQKNTSNSTVYTHWCLDKRNNEPFPFDEMGKNIYATDKFAPEATTETVEFEIRIEVDATVSASFVIKIYEVGLIQT
jgi:lysophospholipase L1-like esterase